MRSLLVKMESFFFHGSFHNIFKLDTRCTYDCIGTSGKKFPKPPWEGFVHLLYLGNIQIILVIKISLSIHHNKKNGTVDQKGMSPCCMKQLAVLLVLTLTFTYVNMRGPNKLSNINVIQLKYSGKCIHIMLCKGVLMPLTVCIRM